MAVSSGHLFGLQQAPVDPFAADRREFDQRVAAGNARMDATTNRALAVGGGIVLLSALIPVGLIWLAIRRWRE